MVMEAGLVNPNISVGRVQRTGNFADDHPFIILGGLAILAFAGYSLLTGSGTSSTDGGSSGGGSGGNGIPIIGGSSVDKAASSASPWVDPEAYLGAGVLDMLGLGSLFNGSSGSNGSGGSGSTNTPTPTYAPTSAPQPLSVNTPAQEVQTIKSTVQQRTVQTPNQFYAPSPNIAVTSNPNGTTTIKPGVRMPLNSNGTINSTAGAWSIPKPVSPITPSPAAASIFSKLPAWKTGG